MAELDIGLLVAAWLTGLAGSGGHCLGMCGGIVGALGVRGRQGLDGFAVLAAAHLGRELAYAAAGASVGLIGAASFGALLGANGAPILRLCAAILIAATGLQLVLGRPLLGALERGGARFWRKLVPLARGLLPPRDAGRALAVGALWGFLPCGLVYAQLAVAAAAGSALGGAAVMAAFGLGTSVGLSALGALLQSLGLARMPRRAAGGLLLVFAVAIAVPVVAPSVTTPAAVGHAHTHAH
jgi:sulfite exporter TauE/SafE